MLDFAYLGNHIKGGALLIVSGLVCSQVHSLQSMLLIPTTVCTVSCRGSDTVESGVFCVSVSG